MGSLPSAFHTRLHAHAHIGAAYLTELFQDEGVDTAICAVPCGIDNTLSSQFVDATVGFHTACQVRPSIK